jgi:hypothetical protein
MQLFCLINGCVVRLKALWLVEVLFWDLQWKINSLTIKVPGLGLYSTVEAVSYDFVISNAQS